MCMVAKRLLTVRAFSGEDVHRSASAQINLSLVWAGWSNFVACSFFFAELRRGSEIGVVAIVDVSLCDICSYIYCKRNKFGFGRPVVFACDTWLLGVRNTLWVETREEAPPHRSSRACFTKQSRKIWIELSLRSILALRLMSGWARCEVAPPGEPSSTNSSSLTHRREENMR